MKNLSFTCDTCNKETYLHTTSEHDKKEIPPLWISIQIKRYENHGSSKDIKLIFRGNMDEQHFCSKECFINSFFQEPKTETS